ncbi:hypothetical protein ACVGWL_00190, partial [Enterobacter asburiae]
QPEAAIRDLTGIVGGWVLFIRDWCDLTNVDGTMARAPECITFARLHNMPVVRIEVLFDYRLAHERKAR